MIARHVVRCPGCEAKIALRIGVGAELEQPFYFVCGRCGAATRGRQEIWYDPVPGGQLVLEEGQVLEGEVDAEQVITIHPDLPAMAGAGEMWDPGGSPFLMQQELLGDRFLEFMQRLARFRGTADRDWPSVRRWIGYYLDQRWDLFDREGERIFEGQWRVPQHEWHRHDVLHKALDVMTAPLWVHPLYPEMKKDWCEMFALALRKPKPLEDFIKASIEREGARDRQRDTFHCLELFMNNRVGILPGLAAEMYALTERAELADLRLFRDEFPQLRDTYISTFEACHHVLEFALGIVNIAHRGNADDFGPGGPKNLTAFRRLTSAKKADLLGCLPNWQKHWGTVLDRGLRNAIGHNSVRHDLPSGMLLVRSRAAVPYVEFVAKTLRLVHPILAAANVLKSIAIAYASMPLL